MNTVQIRPAHITDEATIYQFICDLEETTLDQPSFQGVYRQNLINPAIHYLVAEQQGNVVGFVSCHVQMLLHHGGKVGEIQELFVQPCARNQGIGQQLVAALKAIGVQEEFVNLEVTTNQKRTDTIRFYEREAFHHTHIKLVYPMLMRLILVLLLFSCSALPVSAQSTPKNEARLEQKLQSALAGFRGNAGVYVYHIRTGKRVSINADTLFPTASMIKIPIQCGLFDKIHKGELSYNQELVYKDSLHYDDGIVGSLKDGARITLSKVVMLMETISDNTGSLWCQALAGGGTAINTWLETNGFHQTRVNSRTPGREANRGQYGWGQTTPRDMANLLLYIRQGKAVSPDASDEMYRNLGRQFWDGDGLSQLPPDVKVATKNGAVNQSRSEVVLVHAPHGDYVYCVMTKNQQDQSWERTNEGYALLRTVGSIVWHHFEPKSTWKPADGYEKWW